MWRAIVVSLVVPACSSSHRPDSRTERTFTDHLNGNFAVVRERLPLDLKAGVNSMQFSGATAQLEPESVMLRDPEGRR